MLDEIDLEVTQILLISSPLAAIIGANFDGSLQFLGVGLVLLMAQGRILVRVFLDLKAGSGRRWPYFLVNEGQTLTAVALCSLITVLA